MDQTKLKPVAWVGSSLKDFKAFPKSVQESMGFDLYLAQIGEKSSHVKPLKGFGSAEVMEIKDDHQSGTYRAVYTIRFQGVIYVLHSFQKKSKHGIATPRQEMEVVHQRLKMAESHYKAQMGGKDGKRA